MFVLLKTKASIPALILAVTYRGLKAFSFTKEEGMSLKLEEIFWIETPIHELVDDVKELDHILQ